MKMKNATHGTLTMNRSGEFRVQVYGDNHCGAKASLVPVMVDNKAILVLPIKYHVKVECAATVDPRGFLFDQINVDKFFQGLAMTKLSCEQFAIDCSRKLWKRIHDENPDCIIKKMELTLSPAPHAASMTFTYDSERDSNDSKRPARRPAQARA